MHLDDRRIAATRALEGLSVGDAFGQAFFVHDVEAGTLPPAPWHWTDDTAMALAVRDELFASGDVDPDRLALRFARHYADGPDRGYGGTAHGILRAIGQGVPWQTAASRVFDGGGSMGNGAAMRVAPIGAFACDDLARVVAMADASARPTHTHPDGRAGAIAVAVATAHVFAGGDLDALFDVVLAHTPPGPTHDGIARAASVLHLHDPRSAASILGNGSRIVASDTVPFCLWCVAHGVDDYEAALWRTVRGGGDRDTTCAIVGGIVAGRAEVPRTWRAAREALPELAS
ncbi:MAG: ADP-ribosylglycohydrolase family protein [Sandaracinus sp.]|nr:ADP-ribosylglycohydrolase family protein [Sandaracinus sp.]MCB9631202.1 ADP-ribosylglycohydrolase family protein [Sandaracinus sp.]